jgi:hypothetical protein
MSSIRVLKIKLFSTVLGVNTVISQEEVPSWKVARSRSFQLLPGSAPSAAFRPLQKAALFK